MPAEGWKSVTIRERVLQKLETQYQSRKEELQKKNINSFTSYVSKILEEEIERSEILMKYAPFLSEIGIYENRILLDDKRKDAFFEVVYKNKELFCRGCGRNDCVHVGFAYSIPLVNKTLREEGVKAPKVRT